MKIISKLLLLAVVCLNYLFSDAQQNDTLEIQRRENGKISFARLKPDANRKISEDRTFFTAILQLNANDELQLIKETIDNLGITHRLYQQYYEGIKVENAEYAIHGKNGIIEIINGDFQIINIASVKPALTEQLALDKAISFVHAEKYKWEDATMESFIKKRTNNPSATYYPKGELVITKDFLKSEHNFRLSWKFNISSLNPNNEEWVYVDAGTGEIIRTTPRIYDVNTPCTAETKYSGTLGITGDSYVGGYRLRENRNGVNVQTLNLNGSYNYANATDFTNSNTNFTNGNWTNFTQDRAALDGHWGAENILDYWSIVQNRNSIDGNGMAVLSYIHNPIGNNAYWDDNANVMNYGDGDGLTFNPLTALDICAHEIGHGITQFTSALVHNTQESGALNEGFSDIWGVCVEHWAAPNKQTWLMGEEILIGSTYNCIRNLQNPKSSSAAEGPHPDTYHGQYWDNNGEPHNNSTVLSHWFFLLSQGGNGTNDNGNNYSVSSIGINDAQLIAFRAESVYLTSSATYADARTATIQAARDLFCTGSFQEIATTNAWYAVGVGAAYPALNISGDNIVCTTSNNYTITNLPSGVSVQWSLSPSLATINSPNSQQTTLTATGTGVTTLTATITTTCGGTPVIITKQNIIVGSPSQYTLTAYYTTDGWSGYLSAINCLKTYAFSGMYSGDITLDDPVATSFDWTFISKTPGNATVDIIYTDPRYATVTAKPSGAKVTYRLTRSNSCGNYSQDYRFDANGNFCGVNPVKPPKENPIELLITPNPANDVIQISLIGKNKIENKNAIQQIKILDKTGQIKKIISGNRQPSMTVNISLLPMDVYMIMVFDGSQWRTARLLKN